MHEDIQTQGSVKCFQIRLLLKHQSILSAIFLTRLVSEDVYLLLFLNSLLFMVFIMLLDICLTMQFGFYSGEPAKGNFGCSV